ncbi:hypothetical protein AOLI_G00283630 [Acnodon oligacanthus]
MARALHSSSSHQKARQLPSVSLARSHHHHNPVPCACQPLSSALAALGSLSSFTLSALCCREGKRWPALNPEQKLECFR